MLVEGPKFIFSITNIFGLQQNQQAGLDYKNICVFFLLSEGGCVFNPHYFLNLVHQHNLLCSHIIEQ